MHPKRMNGDPTDPADDPKGDGWDHVADDPEHELVLAVVPGARSIENAEAIVAEVKDRTGAWPPALMTGDEYPASASALEAVDAAPVAAPPAGTRERPRDLPARRMPETLTSATVPKERENNRVVEGRGTVVRGGQRGVDRALEASWCRRTINTSSVARRRATDRGQDARKSRRTDRVSKDWRVHEAMSSFTLSRSNFRWAVRTLGVRGEAGRWQERTPAMAAGLADHVWSPKEWLGFPAIQST